MYAQQVGTVLHLLVVSEYIAWINADVLREGFLNIGSAKLMPFSVPENFNDCVYTSTCSTKGVAGENIETVQSGHTCTCGHAALMQGFGDFHGYVNAVHAHVHAAHVTFLVLDCDNKTTLTCTFKPIGKVN